MPRFATALIALAFTAAALAVSAPANANTKHRLHRHAVHVVDFYDQRPPLTVNRRSWLDPGPVVPQGNMQHYVEANTSLNLTPDQMYTDKFGNDLLPRRFDPPGRPEPLVEFWTPRF
ncbi:MAG: hypothetical protein ACLQIQ_18675 [Beijerinckiaceae bacterium]